ncbi:LPS-assembly lipoprotein LptE [Salinimonas chungwhensis]|uniref:LPS-assembly lipoprotein LptE n=1 Tax=Salinimonas chungwhensis TaxID=265425 RepID=UPI00036DC415|nr:LPS assembly lipoprotein LptE [Salinimonas chungwhensis]
MIRIYSFIFVIAACLSLAGCGFHLRGSQTLPANVKAVAVNAAAPHSRLQRSLEDRLDVYQIPQKAYQTVKAKGHNDTVLIKLMPETVERRLLSVFSTGQVAEYELIYGVSYQVTFPGHDPIQAYFEIMRDYQDDPDRVLAKSRELDLVVSEMRNEAADRIIRRLALQASEL